LFTAQGRWFSPGTPLYSWKLLKVALKHKKSNKKTQIKILPSPLPGPVEATPPPSPQKKLIRSSFPVHYYDCVAPGIKQRAYATVSFSLFNDRFLLYMDFNIFLYQCSYTYNDNRFLPFSIMFLQWWGHVNGCCINRFYKYDVSKDSTTYTRHSVFNLWITASGPFRKVEPLIIVKTLFQGSIYI
jgi:hypothetical protein